MSQVHAIQTLVRVIFVDGTVGTAMLPATEVTPGLSAYDPKQALAVMGDQFDTLSEQIADVGFPALYLTAKQQQQQQADAHARQKAGTRPAQLASPLRLAGAPTPHREA